MKDSKEYYKYPRVPFYLRRNNKEENNKNGKNVQKEIIEKENNNCENLTKMVNKLHLGYVGENQNERKENENEIKTINNCDNINNKPINQTDVINNDSFKKDIFNNINYINQSPKDNNEFHNNFNNKYITPVNKTKKKMNDFYQNQFNQNELLMNYVYLNLDKKGWIIFTNDGDYLSNFTSFELFTFLTNILKKNNDLKMYTIGMQTNSTIFNGEQIYIILSQTLPFILQKKQLECEMMKKKRMKENDEKKLLKLNNNDKENISNNYYPKQYEKNLGNIREKDIFNKYQTKENKGYISQKYQL